MRISEAELIEMQERMRRNGAPGAAATLGATAAAAGDRGDQLEAPIQLECTKLLECDGWRALQTDPVRSRIRGKGFGEIGMADHLYIRYGAVVYPLEGTATGTPFWKVANDVLWIEYKRSKGGKLGKHQFAWHIRERARGAFTAIAGEDFEPTVEGFRKWYKATGLQRVANL